MLQHLCSYSNQHYCGLICENLTERMTHAYMNLYSLDGVAFSCHSGDRSLLLKHRSACGRRARRFRLLDREFAASTITIARRVRSLL